MGVTPWHLAGDHRPIQQIMKTTVNRHDFVRAFETCGRKDQFTTSALLALFEYLEEYEDSCGVELELDPVGICCEWAEHPSALAAAKEYGFKEVCGNDTDCEPEALEWLRNHTQVVEFTGGVVIQLF
jgi:hypothetical protein